MWYDATVSAPLPPAEPAAPRPPVRDRAEVEARVAELAPTLRALGVERVRLFGSFVRGEQTADSDVDLLVTFDPGALSFRGFMNAADLLESAMGRKIDFLTPDGLSPFLGPHILREARDVALAA